MADTKGHNIVNIKTDIITVKYKKNERQSTVQQAVHGKLKIRQYQPHLNLN